MRSIFLIGFMASGKSEVSRAVATRLKMPCVDLDSVVEERAGKTIATLFEEEGEAGFRAREHAVLAELCEGEARVVATGGGTPCQPGLLAMMREAGTVVHLATELSTALGRVGANRASRPLLAQPPAAIEALYRLRAPLYRRANLSVSTDGKTPTEVASDIAAALSCAVPSANTNLVALRERSYPIYAENGALEKLAEHLAEHLPNLTRVGLISDSNVMPLYGEALASQLESAGYSVVRSLVPAGEPSKSLSAFGETVDAMIAGGLDRKSAIVALGGGVVGDLAGYVAASLYRGVPVVQVPTSLLAMTDSSIGGKTGINSAHGKNLLGAFWQPSFVLMDPAVLSTLPARERRAAFGELVKYALLDDALWEPVAALAPKMAGDDVEISEELADLVRACANVKAAIVSEDERERGLRATLNLGHTVGHAIEAHAGYGSMLHGEAVALGLLATCRASHGLGYCDASLESEVRDILKSAGLDTNLDAWLRPEVLGRIGVDKKRTGSKVRFIVLARPGDVRTHDLSLSELTELFSNGLRYDEDLQR